MEAQEKYTQDIKVANKEADKKRTDAINKIADFDVRKQQMKLQKEIEQNQTKEFKNAWKQK